MENLKPTALVIIATGTGAARSSTTAWVRSPITIRSTTTWVGGRRTKADQAALDIIGIIGTAAGYVGPIVAVAGGGSDANST
jgi:hypothetical protein